VTTILLAEDHHIVREGLRALLSAEPGFRVVGEAAEGLQVPGLVESLKPDVLVVDMMMPGLGGAEVTRQARKRSPRTRVVVLSMHAAEAYVIEALRAGASGYVLKDAHAGELLRAIRAAAGGRRYLSPPLSEAGITAYLERVGEAADDPYRCLTRREREVLQLAAEGSSSSAIGRRLGISPRTAESHRAQILRKLGLHNQADITRFAVGRGLLAVEGGRHPARGPADRSSPPDTGPSRE